MASALSDAQWSCTKCTFRQPNSNSECEICGQKNEQINHKNTVQNYGRIIYQIDRFSDAQLTATYTLYLRNPTLKISNWPVYLFGDNDIDNSRPPNTDRDMIGGLAGVAGKYDRNIAFGIVTTFYAYKPMPDFAKFKEMISNQFQILWDRYITNGHDLIIPSPNQNDLKQHSHSFYEHKQQIIHHNIGTGIARLPLLYLKFIQFKIDNISALSHQHNHEKGSEMPKISDIPIPPMISEERKIEFSVNDIIEVCVNPSVDVWVNAIFLGYSDNKRKCSIELMGSKRFMIGVDIKYVRFKNNEWIRQKSEEKKEEILEILEQKSDEWENVSDFVLKEYIRDVSDELSSDLLGNIDEFMRRMAFLGVNSAKSRSRALNIIETMKNERESLRLAQTLSANDEQKKNEMNKNDARNDEFIAAEIAQRIADGHTLEIFDCLRCKKTEEYGGIELRNCNHKICYKCMPQLISSHIAMKMQPTCLKCGSIVHISDIRTHVNAHTAEIVSDMQIAEMMSKQKDLHKCFDSKNGKCNGCIIIEDKYMKEFRCPVCNQRNCLKCKKIHRGNEQCYVPPKPKPYVPKPKYNKYGNNKGNYHITNEYFLNNWVNIKDIKSSNMVQSFDVPLNSEEWHKIVMHIRDPNKRKVARIERIQNAKVWRQYWAYCAKGKRNNLKIGGFWHGTRTHKPAVIWKSNGFLKSKSRIGNCLWFATENTYSMGGFQHDKGHGEHQVFLAFVACGNTADVKFIRQNKILNVYKDAATYPAYLLTYKNV